MALLGCSLFILVGLGLVLLFFLGLPVGTFLDAMIEVGCVASHAWVMGNVSEASKCWGGHWGWCWVDVGQDGVDIGVDVGVDVGLHMLLGCPVIYTD